MDVQAETQDSEQLARAVRTGDRAAIARALNLLDDHRPGAREQARALLDHLLSDGPQQAAHLIGLTGPPGVGKSTLTAALISVWRERNLTVGIIAVDPSSPISGGALLGDRLRMNSACNDDGVFIRSLSNRGQFGGLSSEVWPMSLVMLCCFDIVLVETVGVGQREIDVATSCDTTCFVAQPGAGDSIQFLKAGILEVPHILVVNKSDMGEEASRTLTELRGALGGQHPDGNWPVPVVATSALHGEGLQELADTLQAHFEHLNSDGQLQQRRNSNQAHWLLRRVEDNFGRNGVERLGGAAQFLREFGSSIGNPLRQLDTCQQKLNR